MTDNVNLRPGERPAQDLRFGNEPFGPAPDGADALKPGVLLAGRYQVERLLNANGESKLYLCADLTEGTQVWIREYMPGLLAYRENGGLILRPKPGRDAAYKALMADFRELCAYLSGPQRGERLWPCAGQFEEHNTVYGIFQCFKGYAFSRYLEESGSCLTWAQTKRLFMPILNTVAALNRKGIFHRGLSPDTLLVDQTGRLWLWGLCVPAVRTAGSELDAELFAGYAAPEQYSMAGWQGSWTDVYGLCAVLYKMLTGIAPSSCIARLQNDELPPPAGLVSGLPANVSEAVCRGLKLVAAERLQSADELCAALLEDTGSNTAVYDGPLLAQREPAAQPARARAGKRVAALVLAGVALGFLIWAVFALMLSGAGQSSGGSSAQSSVPSSFLAPGLLGKTLTEVLASSEYNGLFTVDYIEQYNNEYPEGQIFSQQPAADVLMSRGGRMILYVSKGSDGAQMPAVVGSTVASATRLLRSMGIRFEVLEISGAGYQVGFVGRASHEEGAAISKSRDIVYLYTAKHTPSATSGSAPQSQP